MEKRKKKQPSNIEIASKPDPRVEAWAVRQYRDMLRTLSKDIYSTLAPVFRKDKAERKFDSLDEINIALDTLLNKISPMAGNEFAREFTEKALNSSDSEFNKQANKALGVEGTNNISINYKTGNESGQIKTWGTVQGRDMVDMQRDFINKLSREVTNNYAGGLHLAGLTETIRKIGNIELSNAKRIARTETSKIQTLANLERMEKAGVKQIIWKTAGDDRVRTGSVSDGCNHKALNNTVFDPKKGIKLSGGGTLYGAGVGVGVKGCAVINCRCTVIAFYDASKLVQLQTPEEKEAIARENESLGLPRQFGFRAGDTTL